MALFFNACVRGSGRVVSRVAIDAAHDYGSAVDLCPWLVHAEDCAFVELFV